MDVVFDEIDNDKVIDKPDTEIETYESIEELEIPQQYEVGGIYILDGVNEQKKIDPRVQAKFK